MPTLLIETAYRYYLLVIQKVATTTSLRAAIMLQAFQRCFLADLAL